MVPAFGYMEVRDETTSGGLFVLGVAAFLAAAFAAGSDLGLDLWHTGISVLLVDLVAMKLWPVSQASRAA